MKEDLNDSGLYAAVVAPINLRYVWKRVKANNGATGIVGVAIADLPAYAREHCQRSTVLPCCRAMKRC